MATILNPLAPAPTPAVDYAALRQIDLQRQALDHEEMYLNTDAYITGLPQEQQTALNSYLEWAPDPEGSKRKSVNRGYIGDFYGLPDEALGEGGYQTYRDRYAREVLGVPQGGDLNDDSFFELMKERQQKQKDFRGIAEYFSDDAIKSTMVFQPQDLLVEAGRIKKDSQAFPNMNEEDGNRLATHWSDVKMRLEERVAPLRPQAREIYEMLSKGKLERFGDEAQASIEGAIDRLTTLNPDDRAIVISMLKGQMGSDTSGNTVEKTAGAAIRGFAGKLRGFSSYTERNYLGRGMSELTTTGTVDASLDTPEKISQRISSGLPLVSKLEGDIGGTIATPSRTVTPEEQAKVQEMIAAKVQRAEVAAQAIGILEGTIDPIKADKALNEGLLASTGTYVQKTAIDLGYSLGAMATIAIPYAGLLIAQGGYADDEYMKLREEGNDPATAHMASQFTGAMQAGFERVAFLFNFVPSSVIARATATRAGSRIMGVRPALETSTTFRVLSKMGTIQASEYGEEIAQASAPILTAFMGEKLGWNLAEQSKFQGEMQQFKEEGGFWRPEVFSTVMALSVFGGGLSGISDSRQAQAGLESLLRDQTRVEAMGIAPAVAEKIVKTVGVEERKQAYIDAYAERDVQSPTAVAAQKLVTAQVDAQKAQGAAELLAMKNAGLDITRTADGWAVTDTTEPDAAPIPHATAEEAMTTVRSVIKARGMQREETFLDALSDYASIMEPGRTVRLSNKTGTLFEDLTEAIKEGRELSIESIWDRANQVRKKEGQAPLAQDINNPESAEALSGMYVLGRSFNEVQGNVVNKVSMIMRGGGTVDLVEEQAENDLSRSVANGRTTYDVVREVIKGLQKVTGDTYIFSDTTRGITEAWSTLVTLYTTGKARGNRISSGTRRELLAGLREARGDLPADYRAERQRLKAAEASGAAPSAFAKLRAYFDYLKSIMGHAAKIANAQSDLESFRDTLGQVARLKKAAKEGALGDLEALIRESVGLKEKDAFDSALADKVEQMMQPPDDGTGYSISTKRDANYMAAVESGDVATQQALVDEAAKAAAPRAIEPINGQVPDFTELKLAESDSGGGEANTYRSGTRFVKDYRAKLGGFGMWKDSQSTKSRNATKDEFLIRVALHNQLFPESQITIVNISDSGAITSQRQVDGEQNETDEVRGILKDKGWSWINNDNFRHSSGVLMLDADYNGATQYQENQETGEQEPVDWVPFDVLLIPSGNPIVRDEQGNVIPLSQRFNPESENIGYSVKTPSKAELARKEAAVTKTAAKKAAEELATATRIASVLKGVGQPEGPLVAANDVADAKQVPAMIPDEHIGRRFFLAMADLLGASGRVRGVPMQGGAGYPLMNYNPAEPTKTTAAWASSREGVAALLRDMAKTNVIWKDKKDGRHYALLAPNAMDQETHKSNVNAGIVFVADMAHAVETGVINEADNEKLLANIRSKNSTLAAFPGFTDPGALGFFGNLSFENRVVVFDAMQTAEALAAGAPVSDVMLLTTRDQSYHGVEPGAMLSMLLIDIDRMATQVDGNWVLRDDLSAADFNVPPHLSYDTIIPGRLIAHFRTPIPLDVAIPAMIVGFKIASDVKNTAKRKMDPPKPPGKVGRPGYLLTKLPKGIDGQLLTKTLMTAIESVQDLGKMGIHPPAIRALTDAVEGTWLTVNTEKGAGLKEFLKAQARSEARNTLRIYSQKEMIELVEAGTVELYALGKEVAERDVAFAIHKMPDGTKELRSAINNTGVKGMLPLIVARAIEAGANRLEVYAVPTKAKPNGVLPTAFAKHGWVQLGERIPYDRNKLGTTEAERAHKEAALKDLWMSQGWDGQKMPDRVIMSHGGIRTETIDDPTGRGVAKRKTASARSATDGTAGDVRGAVSGGVQGDVPTGGSAGGPAGGRGRVLPRGTDTTVQTLESANLTPAQLRTLGLTAARYEALKAIAAQGAGYSISTRQKASLKMQMTRDEILDAIDKSKDWKDFYTTYQYLLDEYFGEDSAAFQSILSITSQATSVKANVAIALRMYGYWKRGEEFDGKKRGEAESGALSGVLKNLERWRDDVALSGRKISNYQAANEGGEGATEKVVVDRHIGNMLFSNKSPTDAQYTQAEKVLTEIAQSIGWEPRQVQAALWAASIRKSGTEPYSYDQYLKTLRERGTIYERTGATPGGGGIFAAGVERPIRRPVTRRGARKTGTDGYSISTRGGGGAGAGNGGGRVTGRQAAPLEGAPSVPGLYGPDARLVTVAENYARSIGIQLRRQSEYAKVDVDRAKRISDAYEAMPHTPEDPVVKDAYASLIKQTIDQYNALANAGYKFWFIDLEKPENAAYSSSPWNALRDIRDNQQMGVFPTLAGYGTASEDNPSIVAQGIDTINFPMLAETGIEWPTGGLDGPKTKVLANDLFRAVHDAFGHGLEGAGFRARGEENAWQAHVRLFTGSAVAAITSETRGQNSWLNYGPNAATNQTAKTEDTIFAEQKTGLMPLWTWTEGKVGDMPEEVPAEDGYSIASSSRLERIMARLDEIAIDPEVRFDMMQRASAALAKMARDIEFRDDVSVMLNSDEAEKFQGQQANAMAQLIDRYSAEEQRRQRDNEEAMKALKAEHEAALQDLSVKADIEAGGAQEDGWTTDQKDALKVRQRLEQTTLQARQRAAVVALETKQRREGDAAKASEAKEVALLKEKQGAERKTRAKSETEQTKRQDMLDALSTLDAILTPFPAEVRAKVGGFVSLAKLRTNEAMEAYLKDRVEKLNNAVENYLRKDYVEQIKNLIKKGDAKRATGKKPGGKLGAEGHVLFDAVKAAAGMSEEETNKAIMNLSDAIEKARMDDPDAVPVLAEKLQAAVMFGDLNGKTRTARDLAKALTWLKENYERERTKWRMQEEARLAEVARLSESGVDSLDGATTDSDRLNSTAELGEFRAGSSGFSGAMRALFGKESELFKRWTAASRRAIIQRTTEFQALQKDWRDLKDRLYGKGWKGDRKLYDDIVEPVEKSGVLITDKMKKSRETIPVNTAENILAGKAPELAEQYTDAEKAEMRIALDANILEKRPKDTISLTRISGSTVGSEIMLSQGQAMHISLMWRQAQGRAPMEAHGYTEETIEQVEAFMSPEAKAIRDWIASRYTAEWGDLNAVFAGMFGVNLPQIENYSPLTFWSQQRKELANPDPSGGPIMAQGGMSTGMLKERVEKHGAEPRIVNAVDVFFDHMRQVAHFKAFAELAREMRGVMSKPEMRRALAVKHGENGTRLMDKWLDAMEQGGLTQKPGWFESQLANMGGARAVAVLAWNFKSAFTNVLNLLGMARKMPPDQYLKGIVRLFGGRLNWWVGKGSVFQNSEIIQRRINSGMSPEMQAGMSRIANMRPSMLKAFMEGGMALHAYSDAIFTSGSVAIAYDFHLREFLKEGIAPEEAQRMALAATEQSIADVTQPTEFLDKSTVEMERNAMARAIFSFQSDPRQKMALQMEAYAEKDWGRLVKLVIVDHVVTGLIMQTITNAWRDANDDDDGDDVFDPLHWQLSDYLIAAAIGPWSALPMFGPAIDAVGAAFKSGPAINESILTSAGSWAGRGVRMATSEKGKVEPYEMTSDVIRGTAIGTAIMTGDARFAVVARVGSTAFDLLDNYIETAEESISHELKMRRLKDKELNPPAEKTAEEEAQAKVDKAAKNLRELERLREEQKGK